MSVPRCRGSGRPSTSCRLSSHGAPRAQHQAELGRVTHAEPVRSCQSHPRAWNRGRRELRPVTRPPSTQTGADDAATGAPLPARRPGHTRRARACAERRRAVLTPLQRGQLQLLQDGLAQQPFHARLARALQGRVGLGQGKQPERRGSRGFYADPSTGHRPQQTRALLFSRDGLTGL